VVLIMVDAIHAPIVDDSARAVLNGSDIRPAPLLSDLFKTRGIALPHDSVTRTRPSTET
jgi:hypothetical protein